MTFIFPRSYLSGLGLSTAGSSASFAVAIGQASDSTNVAILNFPAPLSKTTAAWAAGTGNGALDTSTIAPSTWYHAYLIASADGTLTDILVSLSASAPTLPAGYTLFRRIGSLKTDGSSQWVLFSQRGDEFLWSAPFGDVNTSIGTTPTLFTVSVPPGVKVNLLARMIVANNVSPINTLVNSPDEDSVAQNSPLGNITIGGAANSAGLTGTINVRTNTSQQIRAVAFASGTTVEVATYGWVDRRGRDD